MPVMIDLGMFAGLLLVGASIGLPSMEQPSEVEEPPAEEATPDPAADIAGWELGMKYRDVGYAGDINGDGIDDWYVADKSECDGDRWYAGVVAVYPGSREGPASMPFAVVRGLGGENLGFRVLAAGDVNGDGFDDLAVSLELLDYFSRIRVFHGGPDGLTQAGLDFAGPMLFGGVMASGDVNGDGFDDLVVGSPGEDEERGRVTLYAGSAEGLARTPIWDYQGGPLSRTGIAVAVGDTNGDGFDDVFLGLDRLPADYKKNHTRVQVHLGTATGPSATPDWIADGGCDDWFQGQLAAADVNGDGFDEVVVSCHVEPERPGGVYVHFGSSEGPRDQEPWNVHTPCGGIGCEVLLAAPGDVNGDGFDDLFAGQHPWYRGSELTDGWHQLYLGGRDGPRPARWRLEGDRTEGSIQGMGDIDGDGYADFAIVPRYNDPGPVQVWRGGEEIPIPYE